MNDSLKNKTYVIAGGSKGIGLELTQQLLNSGATVHVFSRTPGELVEAENLIYHVCDFATDEFESAELPAGD